MKLSEKTTKLIEFDPKTGVIFMLNKKMIPAQIKALLKIYTIFIKPVMSGDNSDSDEDRIPINEVTGMRFSFVKEMRL